MDHGAAGCADNRDAGKFTSPVTPVGDPQEDIAAAGFDGATGDVGGGIFNDAGNLLQGQVVGAQFLLGDIDVNFQVTGSGKVDLGDAGIL